MRNESARARPMRLAKGVAAQVNKPTDAAKVFGDVHAKTGVGEVHKSEKGPVVVTERIVVDAAAVLAGRVVEHGAVVVDRHRPEIVVDATAVVAGRVASQGAVADR